MKRRILCGMLSLVLVLTTFFQMNTFATEGNVSTYCDWATIKECRQKKTAPIIEGTEGRVFAGWYEDEDYQKPLGRYRIVSGAYAKFVDEATLTVKGQITKGTTANQGKTNLRLLTTVDSLNYQSVGFQIKLNGKTQTITSKTVYETVTGYTKDDGATFYKPNEAFCSDSLYFMTVQITEVANQYFGMGFELTPIWTTTDGIVVKGTTRTLNVYEGLEDHISADTLSYGSVWSAPSTVKISKTDSKSNVAVTGGASLSYQAVRNEYESMQLMLTANQAVESYALYATDLKNASSGDTILAGNVDIYVQKHIAHNDTSHGYTQGSTPDALLPMDAADAYGENSIVANQNGGLWSTIYIPKDIAAGTYSGDFLLVVDGTSGSEVVEIPVSLEVVDYTLTDEVNTSTLFSWRYDRVAVGELDGSLAMMEEYYEFFQDYRISLQALPLDTLSGEEVKETLLKYGDRMSTFTISKSIGDIALGVANHRNEFKEQIFAIAEISGPEENYFEKAMCYSTDEPRVDTEDVRLGLAAYAKTRTDLLEECIAEIEQDTTGRFDELKKMDTSEWKASIRNILDIIPISEDQIEWLMEHQTATGVTEMLEAVNCLCPMYDALEMDYYDEFLQLCDENDITLWWYGCTVPDAPYPTYHIADKNLLSARSVSWLQLKYDVQGNLYWDAAAYTDENPDYSQEYVNVYENPYRRSDSSWPAGDGFLAYPGEPYGVYGPVPSMRLMSIRDGMEEYEILCDVEKDFEKNAGNFTGIASIDVDATMDSIFYKPLYSEGMQMNADGATLDFTGLRSRLLNMAATLDKGLVYASSEIVYSKDSTIIPNVYKNYKAVFSCYAQEGSTIKINGSPYTSGQAYEVKGSSTYSEVNTSVTIEVTNAAGESITYTKYVGKGPQTTATSGVSSATVPTQGVTKTPQTYNASENSELILSFDNYANITETSLRVSKLFGESQVNTKAQYITEGTGSWMVRPEGDYGTSEYPWVRMRCTDTTFGTDDFGQYKSILLDVYNDSNEAVSIMLDFSAYAKTDTYLSTGGKAYVLEPNAWTTCEYDLTDVMFSSFVDITQPMQYMTITFLDKKVSEDDTTSAIYLDNLRGVLINETRPVADYSFASGIDFEEASDVGIFRTTHSPKNKAQTSHVAYADTSLAASANVLGLGAYGMKADATGAVWPEYHVKLEQTYEAGEIVTFWMYVEVDESLASGKTYGLEAFNLLSGTRFEVLNNGYPYNTWVQAQVKLADDTEYLRFYTNFDHRNSGTSVFGNAPVFIYMDRFQVTDSVGTDTVTVTGDGTVQLANVDGNNTSQFVYNHSVQAKDVVSFNLNINSSEKVTVSVLADGSMTEYSTTFDSWSGERKISFVAASDAEFITIMVQYEGSNLSNRVCTISTLDVASSNFEFKEDDGGFGTLH